MANYNSNLSDYPRLRARTRKRTSGAIVTYYFWDGRGRGMPEIPIGSDLDKAVDLWRECEAGQYPPRLAKKAKIVRAKPKTRHTDRTPALRKNKRRSINTDRWDELPTWAKRMYLNAERRSIQYRRQFDLSIGMFADLIADSGGKCAVSGMPFTDASKRGPFSPSIDRIDSAKGYVQGNVRMVCLIANLAMNEWGYEALKSLAECIIAERHGERLQNVAI